MEGNRGGSVRITSAVALSAPRGHAGGSRRGDGAAGAGGGHEKRGLLGKGDCPGLVSFVSSREAHGISVWENAERPQPPQNTSMIPKATLTLGSISRRMSYASNALCQTFSLQNIFLKMREKK